MTNLIMKHSELIGASIFLILSIIYLKYLYNRVKNKKKDNEESDASKALTFRVYLYLIFTIICCIAIIVFKLFN